MSLNLVLAFLAAAIMLGFTGYVLQRWWVRRAPAFLFWGIGLALFGLASLSEAFLAIGWHDWVFFTWYFGGAVLTAAWIGQGTLYLLFRKPWVHWLTGVLIIGSVAALVLMLWAMPLLDSTPFTPTEPISEQYQLILPPIREGGAVRLATPFFNIYGMIALVGGALWSAFLFWRKRVLPNRVIGNVLIAAGALSISAASTLTRLGFGEVLYIGELVAAALMFAGFIVAAAPRPQAQEEAVVPATVVGR